eukprot:CAMPEP_0113522996 /NCGR_PEP_ID=MMETSP0014_2-20120614/45481_1 /TAXON_ID=2857 /ORGANISM="Nitzschia sp." /LENGTH=257 /DNA_ID=CAMNT_0000421079 /DNA_START=438 /DNA_END=1208 /DNA_ORIENTATION=- /assembly_acc=CAM_ASM_000159
MPTVSRVQVPQDEETAIEMERNNQINGVGTNTVGIMEGDDEEDDDDHHHGDDDEEDDHDIDHNSRDGLMIDSNGRHRGGSGRSPRLRDDDDDVVRMRRGTVCQLVFITLCVTLFVGLIGFMKGKQAGAQSYAAYMNAKKDGTPGSPSSSSSSSSSSANVGDDDDDYFRPTPPPRTRAPHSTLTGPTSPSSSSSSPSWWSSSGDHNYGGVMMDGKTFTELSKDVGLIPSGGKKRHTVTYNPDWITTTGNPFDPLFLSS